MPRTRGTQHATKHVARVLDTYTPLPPLPLAKRKHTRLAWLLFSPHLQMKHTQKLIHHSLFSLDTHRGGGGGGGGGGGFRLDRSFAIKAGFALTVVVQAMVAVMLLG